MIRALWGSLIPARLPSSVPTPVLPVESPPGCVEITVAGERLILSPLRVAYWPTRRTLLVSDLHLGKADALRFGGSPLSDAVTDGLIEEPLTRLSAAALAFDATRILVLGDLVHAPVGLTPRVVSAVTSWRTQCPVAVDLITGNHDTAIHRVATEWKLGMLGEHASDGPFDFIHIPPRTRESPRAWIAGHLHPSIRISSRGERIPCFAATDSSLLLPAFSSFTGGTSDGTRDGQRLYAVTPDGIVPMFART